MKRNGDGWRWRSRLTGVLLSLAADCGCWQRCRTPAHGTARSHSAQWPVRYTTCLLPVLPHTLAPETRPAAAEPNGRLQIEAKSRPNRGQIATRAKSTTKYPPHVRPTRRRVVLQQHPEPATDFYRLQQNWHFRSGTRNRRGISNTPSSRPSTNTILRLRIDHSKTPPSRRASPRPPGWRATALAMLRLYRPFKTLFGSTRIASRLQNGETVRVERVRITKGKAGSRIL